MSHAAEHLASGGLRGQSAARMRSKRSQPFRVNICSWKETQNGTASLKLARSLGAAWDRLCPVGPIGMGYLTGKLDARTKLDPKTDLRTGFDRFSPENLAANKPVVEVLKSFAEKKNASPAQIALAWLLAKKPWIVPIPGTRNPDHLSENLGAIDVELTPADLQAIETAIPKIAVHGGRMNEMQMQQVDQTI